MSLDHHHSHPALRLRMRRLRQRLRLRKQQRLRVRLLTYFARPLRGSLLFPFARREKQYFGQTDHALEALRLAQQPVEPFQSQPAASSPGARGMSPANTSSRPPTPIMTAFIFCRFRAIQSSCRGAPRPSSSRSGFSCSSAAKSAVSSEIYPFSAPAIRRPG